MCIKRKQGGEPVKSDNQCVLNNMLLSNLFIDRLKGEYYIGRLSSGEIKYLSECTPHVLVYGGPATGCTARYVMPNLKKTEDSFICIDPHGEHRAAISRDLVNRGYTVKTLNLLNLAASDDCYNPFVYVRNMSDIESLADIIFQGNRSSDPFWDNAAKGLLLAVMFYVYLEYPAEQQNFREVYELVAKVSNLTESSLFDDLKERDPEHIAVKYWFEYAQLTDQCKSTITATLKTKLAPFDPSNFAYEGVTKLTGTDTLELAEMERRKTALFVEISNCDSTFYFLASMLIEQAFHVLLDEAENKYHGLLPVPVRFYIEELRLHDLPKDFDTLLAVSGSYGVSVSRIITDFAGLKEPQASRSNYGTLLYLGGGDVEQVLAVQAEFSNGELLSKKELTKMSLDEAFAWVRGLNSIKGVKLSPVYSLLKSSET